MSKLSADVDTVDETTPDGAIVVEPEWLTFLRNQGYPVLDVHEVHTVASNSRELNHMTVRISTYDKPEGASSLDVVEDTVDLWVCSCEDWQYNQSADVSEDMVKPSDSGNCKHILEVDMAEKAKADDSQAELDL